MSNHRPGYVVAVCFLTFLLSIPSGYFFYQVGLSVFWSVQGGTPLLPSIPGSGQYHTSYSDFSYATLWRDHFVIVRPDHEKILAELATGGFRIAFDWKITLIDPESGTSKESGWELSGDAHYSTKVVGDRLLFFGSKQQFEVIDDVVQPADFPFEYDSAIVLDNEIAGIHWHHKLEKLVVTRRKPEGWVEDSFVVHPAEDRVQHPINAPGIPVLKCICRDDQIYAFLKTRNHLFFREGLQFQKIDDQGQPIPLESGESESNSDDEEYAGWSLVPKETVDPDSVEHQYGALFEEKPAALIVDQVSTGHPVGHFFKFNGNEWSEIASLQFPFGSNWFRVLTRSGDQSPYVVATTSTGTGFAYVVEPLGFRRIERTGPAETWKFVRRDLIVHFAAPAIAIVLSLLPGFAIWLLMMWFTDPHYEFGIQSVRLAPLGRRGLARLIDFAWMTLLPLTFGWIWMRDFDWLSLAESIELKLDHPTLHTAYHVLNTLVILLILETLFLVVIQGCWGITPGKWLCGLRTLRTTLRPCGIARSLVREVMLVAETFQLICWLPPMLSIALTNQRQRLGDLVSDTIVVEAKTRTSIDSK